MCGCSTDGSGATPDTTASQAPAEAVVLTVSGMTCSHCEQSVSKELSALPGVTAVTADAKTGKVTVSSTEPLDDTAVRAAVDEAGYEFVGRA